MSKKQAIKFLELQEKGSRVTIEVARQLGYQGKEPQRKLRQDLRRIGYHSVEGVYIKKSTTNVVPQCGTISNTSINKCPDNSLDNYKDTILSQDKCIDYCTHSNSSQDKCADNSNNSPDSSPDSCTHNSNTFDEETTRKLLILADNFDNILSKTSRDYTKEKIKVKSCEIPTAQTIKVDFKTWKMFKEFAKASNFKQQDLVTTALDYLMKNMQE